MKRKVLIKIIAALISVSLVFASVTVGGFYSFAEETSATEPVTETTTTPEQAKEEAQKRLEQQKAEFDESLKALDEKLAQLASESKNTEEYINTLDTRIGVLNEELTVLDEQVTGYIEDIDALQKSIDENQLEADALQSEVDKVQNELDALNRAFEAKYEAYCLRMRAIYISGSYNIITALLTCGDISSFLTRYEMIKAVSKSDAQLLEDIKEQTNKILAEEADLNDKKATLDDMNINLIAQRNELQNKQNRLTSAQEEIASKKISLSEDRAESNRLFAELTVQTGLHTEFRNEDEAVKQAIEDEISGLLNGLIDPEDVTLGTTSDRSGATAPSYAFSDVYSHSDGVLNMTYPVPGHYTVSAGFPNYSNGGYHGGIDYPCPKGSKVVAAQSGVVLLVKRLETSYGHYIMIYHGTDSKGRKIVTLYAHNSDILVSAGDTVARGQQIARSGSTGNSTGPHCHFEIRMDNKQVNPKNYLSK